MKTIPTAIRQKKKNILTSLLALVLWVGLTTAASAADTDYTDVPDDHWAAESIKEATSLGIFQGVSENRFGLGQPISRAEFVTALVRYFGWEAVTPQRSTYADVSPDAWYASAVETARANGAVAASGREFRPEEVVNRADMASMLLRSLGYTYLAGAASEYSVPFNDVTVNRGFITLAYDLGLMTGTAERTFDPEAPATREQAATLLVRVHAQLSQEAVRLDNTSGWRTISIAVPMAQEDAEMPITPLEPLTDLYATLRRMKYNDGDMAQAALRLTAGGVRTVAGEGIAMSSDVVTPSQVQAALALPDAKPYYSEQYESAYCIYSPAEGQKATLWYQSEKSMAAKLQLAKLFGVTHYVLE